MLITPKVNAVYDGLPVKIPPRGLKLEYRYLPAPSPPKSFRIR